MWLEMPPYQGIRAARRIVFVAIPDDGKSDTPISSPMLLDFGE
jgi:hypothetical protein